jgi:hypothetical protein
MPQVNPYTILTRLGLFVGTAAVGAVLTFAVTEVLKPAPLTSKAATVPDVLSTPAPGTAPVAGSKPIFAVFNVIPDTPKPVAKADPAVLQIISEQEPEAGPDANGIPRVPPLSQFDGSPFQGANCNLAAGAMLARLGWGIVTTGGILRTLQDDQVGGTDLGDLTTALWRGYGVSPAWGAVTNLQLRRLIESGYGAVVHGLYGVIRPPYNIQPTFKGPHAIYIDAFFPGSSRQGPAYYVIDPLHKPGSGYRGEWMPASLVEEFALALGGPSGRIMAAWAFPVGGTPPEIADIGVLPPNGGASPRGGEPPPDPADPPVTAPTEPGDTTVELAPTPPTLDGTVTVGGEKVPRLDFCVILPRPLVCPGGIIGRYGNGIPGKLGGLVPTIEVRFVDSSKPNVVLVGFTISTSAVADVEFWRSDGSGGVRTSSSMSSVTLPGSDPMLIARLETDAATAYQFQVVASGILVARSPIGSFKTGAGLKGFDFGLIPIDRPIIGVDDESPVYTRLRTGEYTKPMQPCTEGRTSDHLILGGLGYCLPSASTPTPETCTGLKVDYELIGMTGDQVSVRAAPLESARMVTGAPAGESVIEALGPIDAGNVTLGCLTPGVTYQIAIDIPGDPLGPIETRVVTVPST